MADEPVINPLEPSWNAFGHTAATAEGWRGIIECLHGIKDERRSVGWSIKDIAVQPDATYQSGVGDSGAEHLDYWKIQFEDLFERQTKCVRGWTPPTD